MRKIPIATLAGVLAISTVAMAQTTITNGWEIYTGEDSHITCHERPVLLTGNHTDLTLSGPCRYVRLTGWHNDVTLTVVPGGTIEITGAHNDVFWHALDPTAAAPILLDKGYSNTFHRRTGNDD